MNVLERINTGLFKLADIEHIYLQTEEIIEDGIAPFRKFLEEAQEEVQIATNNINSGLYNHPQIISVLEKLGQRKVAIRIIHPKTQPLPDSLARLAKREVLKIHPISGEITNDFWVIDGLDTLVQDPPDPGEKERVFNISHNVELLARRLQTLFHLLKLNTY
jgi:hypothetical protein